MYLPAFTFSPFDGVPELGGNTVFAMQVIWIIGASMIVLAGCQYLGVRACLIIGAVIVFGHNALNDIWPTGQMLGGTDPLWYGLQTQSSTVIGPIIVISAYPLIPWVGVMLLGYGTASLFEKEAIERDRILLIAGISMICAFVIIRATGLYGEANPWQIQEAGLLASVFDFMNLSKYPPSLLFLLATLGPMAIFCAYADRMSGALKDALVMFGRVPFVFYVAHFYLIRLFSFALAWYQGFEPEEMMTFFFFLPEGYGVSLSWVYVIWILVLILLYPICKWMAELKTRRKDWWLSYL
ncbi:MAG: hypothetical protein COA86_17250 [Kangiella sp.]|nr:MAG: hypothetical protein COA86_17250 [Kangiella sp.]